MAEAVEAALSAYRLFDGLRGVFALGVVGDVFELDFLRQSDEAVGEAGRYDGVGELPYPADGILEGSVAVDEHLDVAARAALHLRLELAHEFFAAARSRTNSSQPRGKSFTESSLV